MTPIQVRKLQAQAIALSIQSRHQEARKVIASYTAR